MRSVLSSLIGEPTNGDYNPDKFRLYGAAPGSGRPPASEPPEPEPPAPLPTPAPLPSPLDLDEGTQTGGLGAPQPVQMGCWLLPQDYRDIDAGARQPILDRSATAAKSQIAVLQASAGPYATLAEYDEKTFRTPFEVTENVIVEGQLVNTYTGEISEIFSNALPGPDRQGGDPEREWKNATLRLQAAQGYEPRRLRKKELEQPLPPADSGPILANASFRQMQAVAQESDERCSRDRYFLRNDLVPTEPQMTTNPYGYRGFQNMIRVNPYLLPTQQLDNKAWMANAQELPTTARFLETETRLHRDALAGRVGLAEGGAGFEDQVLKPSVRVSETQRNTSSKECGRSAVYGGSNGGGTVASAESVARTLRGFGEKNVGGNMGTDNNYGGGDVGPGSFSRRQSDRLETSASAQGMGNVEEQRTGGRTGAVDRRGPQESGGAVQGRPDVGVTAVNIERSRVSTKAVPVRNVYGSAGPSRGGETSGIVASRGFVASAEECKKSLGLMVVAGGGNNVDNETAAFRANTSEATRRGPRNDVSSSTTRPNNNQGGNEAHSASTGSQYLRSEAPIRRRATGTVDGLPEGAAAASGTYLGVGERQLEGSVPGTWLPDGHKIESGPTGQKFLSDKRGIVVVGRAPGGYEKVGGDTIPNRRAPAPERPPEEAEVYVIRTGQPDAIESQRAFRGENVRKVRERGPTPRKGGAERVRGGLSRLMDPPETRSG